MLTRIEIDGFKSFQDFSLDLAPFMVILGPNATGKSNLFDAIRLLSQLAAVDLRSAMQGMRGEVDELFRALPRLEPRCVASPHGYGGVDLGTELASRMRFAVEVLIEPEIRDPWGAAQTLKHTRIRYEVTLERRRYESGIERLFVVHEQASPILRKDDQWIGSAHRPSKEFRERYLRYSGRTEPYLLTETRDDLPEFRIRFDGRAGRSRPAEAAQATVLSSITSTDFPHLFALREEMRSWRYLHLDPAGLRRPSPTTAEDTLQPDGANLATVLARIKAETATQGRPAGDIAGIAAALVTVVPGVLDLDVIEDRARHEFRIELLMRDGRYSSRVISDGTLRVLALLTMLFDKKHHGLLCFEEPENGIHPARLHRLLDQLRALGSPLEEPSDDDGRQLSQLLMNSHSPVVLSALAERCSEHEIVFSELTTVTRGGVLTHRTRVRPVSWQGSLLEDPSRSQVTAFEVDQFLSTVSRRR